MFKIAEKAEKLLQELLNAKKVTNVVQATATATPVVIKNEPQEQEQLDIVSLLKKIQSKENDQQQHQQQQQVAYQPVQVQYYPHITPTSQYVQYPVQYTQQPQPQIQLMSPSYYMTHPPPPMPLAPINYQYGYGYQQYIRPPINNFSRKLIPTTSHGILSNVTGSSNMNGEDDDINIMRERELNQLKCKSICEKMGIFVKYYIQFKETYINRIKIIECSDSLKYQYSSLIKYLIEYEGLLIELNTMIQEHERDYCRNNHRKIKKFFNKTKSFIRYDCQKRLQTNIFELRRQINSQDRYAGMYDLLDMNNYLIGLLPDIGVSIRRFINKCEKSREEDYEDEYAWNLSDEDSDIDTATTNTNNGELGVDDHTLNENQKENNTQVSYSLSSFNSDKPRSYESFSKGVDSLNRYLLKRVEEEESLDELVKERIIKWINKRQSKYILIFADVDKLLNQHKDGECNQKFHSYLQFNLGKLVTVCESYHQKLKELLYSTTIRRKKKRKKVKLLPEAMGDVFSEINELKRALEQTKLIIKKCNQIQ